MISSRVHPVHIVAQTPLHLSGLSGNSTITFVSVLEANMAYDPAANTCGGRDDFNIEWTGCCSQRDTGSVPGLSLVLKSLTVIFLTLCPYSIWYLRRVSIWLLPAYTVRGLGIFRMLLNGNDPSGHGIVRGAWGIQPIPTICHPLQSFGNCWSQLSPISRFHSLASNTTVGSLYHPFLSFSVDLSMSVGLMSICRTKERHLLFVARPLCRIVDFKMPPCRFVDLKRGHVDLSN